ncbi:ligand-binding sensor domain-containing protein [Siphonobacter aquaeclarae]|nr:sensor histidine kinase [Siphonobacter aquaeclarae]
MLNSFSWPRRPETGRYFRSVPSPSARSYLMVFLFFRCCVGLQGQGLTFKHLSTRDGLSDNVVYAIAQDTTGYMWFATSHGLNVYDSRRIRSFIGRPGDSLKLSGNYVTALLSDSRGTLWVGTSTGLNIFNPQTESFRPIVESRKKYGLANGQINCFYEDSKGRIWVCTVGGLSLLTSQANGTFRNYLHSDTPGTPGIRNVMAIYEESPDVFWIGTRTGLFRMTLRENDPIFQEFPQHTTHPGGLHDTFVLSIAADSQKKIWVGTKKAGLHRWDPETKQFTHFPASPIPGKGPASNEVRKLLPARDGSLWIGTFDGISILNPATLQFTTFRNDPSNPSSLTNNSIYSIFQDRAGSLWIGTYHKGINIVHDPNPAFHRIEASPNGLSDEVVSAVLEDSRQNLWIGTQGRGLNQYNRRTGSYRHFRASGLPDGLASDHIQGLTEDASGIIWISTYEGGLTRLDPESGKMRTYRHRPGDPNSICSDMVFQSAQDHKGRIWIGSNTSGLSVLDPATGKFFQANQHSSRFRLDDLHIRSLMVDKKGNIWIGTTKSVDVFTEQGRRIFRIPLPIVRTIYEDSRNRVWLGTYHNGLHMYQPGKMTIRSYSRRDGFAGDNIMGILEDKKGQLWLSTGNGLSSLDPQSQTIRNYNTVDGLASNEFKPNAAFASPVGDFFWGTDEGVVFFNPENVHLNTHAPRAVLTDLKLFNMPVRPHDESGLLDRPLDLMPDLTFNHLQSIFTIDFAGLTYIKQGKNKYAYQLEGLESRWNLVSVPSATYTNLKPGNYTFRVKVANNDGVWGKPRSLRITVLPPWWKTWWAYTFYAVLLGGIVFLIGRFFWLRTVLRYEQALYQAKLDFFTNIAHEVRTHIMLILGPVDMLLTRDYDERKVRSRLTSVKANGDRLLRLVNELLDFRKAEVSSHFFHLRENELVSFLKSIFQSFSHLSEARKITAEFTTDSQEIFVPFDPEQLEKVIFNLLFNAYKFTPEGGTIGLSVAREEEQVSIRVSDNGPGIAPEHLKNLFVNFFQVNELGKKNAGFGIGLALSKKIVDQHGGTLTVKSTPAANGQPGGTVFTVRLRTTPRS